MELDSASPSSSVAFREYEAELAVSRRRLAARDCLRSIADASMSAAELAAFLFEFCARGVGMTAPVQGWIERAGRELERVCGGEFRDFGRALVRHSREEAGHDEFLKNDARWLAGLLRARFDCDVDVSRARDRESCVEVRAYSELHEQVIAGTEPYAQIAIEYEIEHLSVVHGPGLIEFARSRLGPEVDAGLQFLNHHVRLDVGHTEFNRRQLTALLELRPRAKAALVSAGTRALQTYGAFLDRCYREGCKRVGVRRDRD